MHFQSSSTDLLYLTGTTNVTNLNGTPKKVIADSGVTIGTLKMGTVFYGRTDEVVFSGCTINAVTLPGGQVEQGTGAVGVNVAWTMVSGLITVPNTHGANPWAIPGTWCFWSGQYDNETSFQILSVTQDVTNTYIQTSMSGGFPSVPLTSGKLFIRVHPAPVATFTNVTGCEDVLDFSRNTAGRPLGSYSRRTYTKTLTGIATPYYVWGNIQLVGFNVTQAFAGTQNPLTLHGFASSDNSKTIGPPTSYTVADYGPIINLRILGNRVITPSSVTGTQSGDSALALPTATINWLPNVIAPAVSSDVHADASNFSVTIEIMTDQGLTPPISVSNIKSSRSFPHHGK